MAYPISDVPRRIVYSGSAGVGPYAFTFEVLANTDIAVYKNTTLLTLTTDYTVSINTGTGTGTVTLVVAATAADTVTLVGDRAIQRTSDFVTGGDLFANTLNDELDAQTIYAQQIDEKADRAIKSRLTDPIALDMTLPTASSRANKLMGFTGTGTPAISTRTIAEVDAAVSSFVNATGNNAASILYDPPGITGTAQAGASAAITLASGASASDDTYNGYRIEITGGTGSGQVRTISDYVGATKVATVSAAWVTTPDATSVYNLSLSTTVQAKLRETVSVKDFGAVGDGVTDDTAAIQAAIDAVSSGGRVVGDAQSVFKVTDRINLSNKELRDIRLTYTSNSAMLVLGGNARLTNTTISVGSTSRIFQDVLPGVINLHLATGVVIDNVEITDGISNRVGVFCATRASNTTIRNCRMNYIGWPIWFNDAYPAQRIVDGVDYAGQTIGSGLYIHGCEVGAADKTSVGDAIEINCPTERFSNVRVVNCTALKTVSTSPTNGLGFGFANCDTLQVSNCLLKNTAAGAGAIHMEHFTSASITDNTIESCNIGIGLGIRGEDCVISGNTIDDCIVAIQCISDNITMTGITINGNQVVNSRDSGIVMSNVSSVIISNNMIKDIINAGVNRQYIALQQSGSGVTNQYLISGNIFSKIGGQIQPLLGLLNTITEVFSRNNVFYGIGASEIVGYIVAVRGVGLTEDHYRAAGTTNAINGTINVNPTGYITGTLGDFMTDVNAGVLYRNDGTNWVAKVS